MLRNTAEQNAPPVEHTCGKPRHATTGPETSQRKLHLKIHCCLFWRKNVVRQENSHYTWGISQNAPLQRTRNQWTNLAQKMKVEGDPFGQVREGWCGALVGGILAQLVGKVEEGVL